MYGYSEEADRRLREQRYQESLAAQMAEQVYRNQALGINNVNDVSQMQNQQAALGLNFAGDNANMQLQQLRMGGDLAQLAAHQRDLANSGRLNVAQLQSSQRQQQLGAQDDISRLLYQRANSEMPSDYGLYKRAYGYS